MSERSLPAPARTTHQPLDKELLADSVERVLARLRAARPQLESRLDRAATYLVVQLSSSARTRPIRCRIRKGGRRVYLVDSLSSGGVTYEVSPLDWSCSCPDHHRHGPGCKHSLGCWVLATANTPLPKTRPAELPCEDCGEILPREETLNPGMRVCRMCARDHGLPIPRSSHEAGEAGEAGEDGAQGDEGGDDDQEEARMLEREPSEGLTHAEVGRWLERRRWIYAKSRPTNPHEYTLRREAGDEAMFEAVVGHLREFGHPYPWWGEIYLQYVAGYHAFWTMGARPQETILINRKSLERVRIDQLTNKGGGGIVWPWLHQDVEAEREELRRQETGQSELGGGE